MSEEYKQLVQRAQQAALDAKGYCQQAADALQQANNIAVEINDTQLVQLGQAKEAIKQAIINKGQNVDQNVSFIEYAQKINQIESNSIDISDANEVQSTDVSEGLVFYNAQGKQTGTLKDVTATLSDNIVTVPAGRIRNQQTLTVQESSGLTVNKKTVSVGKGYIKQNSSVSVQTGQVQVENNTVIIKEGYVENNTIELEQPSGGDGSSDSAIKLIKITKATEHKDASQNIVTKVVVSGLVDGGYYEYSKLNGEYLPINPQQSNKYDIIYSNGNYFIYYNKPSQQQPWLSAGWAISYRVIDDSMQAYMFCSGSKDKYLSEINGLTWYAGEMTGQTLTNQPTLQITTQNFEQQMAEIKGVVVNDFNEENNSFIFSTTESNYSANASVPLLQNGIFVSKGNLLVGQKLVGYDGTPTKGLVFYNPLTSDISTAPTGQTLIKTGNPIFKTYNGRSCAYFDGSSNIITEQNVGVVANLPCTLSAWMWLEDAADWTGPFIGKQQHSRGMMIGQTDGFPAMSLHSISDNGFPAIPYNQWLLLTFVVEKSILRCYINGVEKSAPSKPIYMNIANSPIYTAGLNNLVTGHIAELRLYNRALNAEEVKGLYLNT